MDDDYFLRRGITFASSEDGGAQYTATTSSSMLSVAATAVMPSAIDDQSRVLHQGFSLSEELARLDALGVQSPFDLFCRHVQGPIHDGDSASHAHDDGGGGRLRDNTDVSVGSAVAADADTIQTKAVDGEPTAARSQPVAEAERKLMVSKWLQIPFHDKDVYIRRFRELSIASGIASSDAGGSHASDSTRSGQSGGCAPSERSVLEPPSDDDEDMTVEIFD